MAEWPVLIIRSISLPLMVVKLVVVMDVPSVDP